MEKNISNLLEGMKNMPNGLEKSKLFQDIRTVINKKSDDGEKIEGIKNISKNIKKRKYVFASADDALKMLYILDNFINFDFTDF